MPRSPGYKWSDESRAKLSKSRRGVNQWGKAKAPGINAYDRHIRLKYGVTEEFFKKLYEKQGGVCAICHKPETVVFRGTLKKLSIDHNHTTGQVRGLLCTACNYRVGVYETYHHSCQEYLDRYK